MHTWLYILAVAGPEDLLKVGLTRSPLARWGAFHPRWYEAFDLRRSLLVGCETRRDAQQLETALHRQLRPHGCPMPLTIRVAAAGATEWFRGAYAHALEFVLACEAAGHQVERDPRAFLMGSMRADADRLDGLIRQAHAELMAGWLGQAPRQALLDWVDGHLYFDAGLEGRLPAAELDALRRNSG